jgi:hypothetical protein
MGGPVTWDRGEAFDGGLVRNALSGTTVLLDDEPVSLSSGQRIHRIVVRKPMG